MSDLQTRIHQEGDTTIFESVQDCTPYLERVKGLHNGGFHGTSETKHAASVPNVVVERFCNLRGITFKEFISNKVHIKALLNDPDLKAWRIWPGAV